jgi:hypothetical protein
MMDGTALSFEPTILQHRIIVVTALHIITIIKNGMTFDNCQ